MYYQFVLSFTLCATSIFLVTADKQSENATKAIGRSARNDFLENSENRLPATYRNKFYESDGPYAQFSDRRDRYDKDNHPAFEIPTGFDQFVPDKSSGTKYSYGSGDFYLPYPPNAHPDYSIEEIKDRNDNKLSKNPSFYTNGSFKIKDLMVKAMNFITGTNDAVSTEVEERPSFSTSIKQIFRDPMIVLTAIVVPLGFLLATVIPFFTKMLMKTSILPAVTTSIANTVARSLDSSAAEQILEAINEFGAKAMDDPKCLQRFLCQSAKAHIESRSEGSWSAHSVVQKLVKAVDDKLWDALGLKMFFSSLQSGHCETLQCNGYTRYSGNGSFGDKLQTLFARLFNYTEVVS